MGYMHIDNLYKNTEILLFKECYALEKIHGTSAHITWKAETKEVILFSGGVKYVNFEKLFDKQNLKDKFEELFDNDTTIFGEAYGGPCQKMRETYGDELKFVAFDIKVGYCWLDVPTAEGIVLNLGLEFVDYHKVSTDLNSLDNERDMPSTQAFRNGLGNNKIREGVVLRPLIELTKNNGKRIIAKHKADSFLETATKRKVNVGQLKVLQEAEAIANEWVTPMRLNHVLDKLNNPNTIQDTGKVIKAMVEDVYREGKNEIVESKQAMIAISKHTAKLYKNLVTRLKNE